MRTFLEKEMLAESLQGRVRYNCTSYVGMDGCRVFELFIDGQLIKRFSWETVNSYFLENGLKDNNHPYGTGEYWDGFWDTMERFPVQNRTEYTDEEFCDALGAYRNQKIEISLSSANPLQRMFALLDKRTGKRKLRSIQDSFSNQPGWLQNILKIRLDAENK